MHESEFLLTYTSRNVSIFHFSSFGYGLEQVESFRNVKKTLVNSSHYLKSYYCLSHYMCHHVPHNVDGGGCRVVVDIQDENGDMYLFMLSKTMTTLTNHNENNLERPRNVSIICQCGRRSNFFDKLPLPSPRLGLQLYYLMPPQTYDQTPNISIVRR